MVKSIGNYGQNDQFRLKFISIPVLSFDSLLRPLSLLGLRRGFGHLRDRSELFQCMVLIPAVASRNIAQESIARITFLVRIVAQAP